MGKLNAMFKSKDKRYLEKVAKRVIKLGYIAIIKPKGKQYILYTSTSSKLIY